MIVTTCSLSRHLKFHLSSARWGGGLMGRESNLQLLCVYFSSSIPKSFFFPQIIFFFIHSSSKVHSHHHRRRRQRRRLRRETHAQPRRTHSSRTNHVPYRRPSTRNTINRRRRVFIIPNQRPPTHSEFVLFHSHELLAHEPSDGELLGLDPPQLLAAHRRLHPHQRAPLGS